MKIISTFHPSSSVLRSVKCRLVSRELEHLVVAKLSRIDVYSLQPHGLQHECGLDVWGKVCTVRDLPTSAYDGRSNIVLMITHPDPELLILSYEEHESGQAQLIVQKQISLFERSRRLAEFLHDCIIHPSGRLAIVSCYAGKLKVVSLRGGQYLDDFDVSLPETNVFSLAFLSTDEHDYTIAILHLDWQRRLQLCARDIAVDKQELSYSFVLQPTVISDKVFPCPTEMPPQLIPVLPNEVTDENLPDDAFIGGVLVVGGRQILLFDLASKQSQEKQRGKLKRLETKRMSNDPAEVARAKAKDEERGSRRRKPKASVEWPWSELTAWTAIDKVSPRYLLGDSFGRLSMLSLDNLVSSGMILIPLGECSQPTTLTYLTNQIVYVGSHLGDSQLLQISPTPTSTKEVLALSVPSDVKTVSLDSLLYESSRKGKGRAATNAMDVDHDDVDIDGYSHGRVVTPKGSFVNVLESYKNIAPIMDAVLVDPDKSGQYQIVTCSGGANTGSLNVIRTGTNFKELGTAPGFAGIFRIWSAKTMIRDLYDSHVLVSTANGSHLFQIENGKAAKFRRIDAGTLNALLTNQPTLAFSNLYRRQNGEYVNSSLVVQVVPTGVHLFEWDSSVKGYTERDKWDVKRVSQTHNVHQDEIVVACVNSSQIGLALSGGNIVFLRIGNNVARLELQLHDVKMKTDISAMSLSPLNTTLAYSRYLVVAFWGTNIVEIFEIKADLHSIVHSPALPSLVRSVLLYNFGSHTNSKEPDYHAYLLVGMGNGSIATMLFRGGQLKDPKIISLGHAPVHLTPCVVDGRKAVLAVGNRATVLFMDKGRLVSSPIMLKEIAAVSSLHTETFPSSLMLAAPAGLSIGCIVELNKMHIRSVPFGLDAPRRIVHEPSLKVYGISSVRVEPARVGGYEVYRSSFQLIDDNTLTVLGQYRCEPDEEITSVATFTRDVEDRQLSFFCLGTYIYNPEETEPTSGRLLIFTAFPDMARKSTMDLSMLADTTVKGCVFALRVVEEKIVAAVNSAVLLFHLEISNDGLTPSYSLKKLAEWNHNYLVTSLGSFGDYVVAGDQISSISLLKIGDNGIISQARDYGPVYPVAVEALDNRNFICANDALNLALFTLNKNMRGECLELVGFYHVGDMVSKILPGSLAAVEKDRGVLLNPEMIFFTSSGRICVVIDVQDSDLSLHLTELERNLASSLPGIGVSHTKFRAPKSTGGPTDADATAYGFLDGDLLERYLTLLDSPAKLKQVLQGRSVFETLKISEVDIPKVLDQLQRLH